MRSIQKSVVSVLEALAAVDGTILAGSEGNLGVLAAIGAILHLTKVFPLRFPITVPLVFFIVGAVAMIRGIRNTTDFNFERSIEATNRRLFPEITTIMLVTHDAKVAAKCSRVLFIVDGNIKGEYNVDVTAALRDRERSLNNWLMEMGW